METLMTLVVKQISKLQLLSYTLATNLLETERRICYNGKFSIIIYCNINTTMSR